MFFFGWDKAQTSIIHHKMEFIFWLLIIEATSGIIVLGMIILLLYNQTKNDRTDGKGPTT